MLYNYIKFLDILNGGNTKVWSEMSHNGVLFSEEYESKSIKLIHNNNEILLSSEAEETLFYAKFLNTEYVVILNLIKFF